MNRRLGFSVWLLLISGFVLSACMGLIPLQEEPVTGDFGPRDSPAERQEKTFEALWQHLEDNYIYYETADVDWDALHNKYLGRLKSGLTTDEFAALMRELARELPQGGFDYETRAERITRETADNSTYEGIGAFIGFSEEPEPHIVLLDVIDGSPAEEAGLAAHDSIFEIDGSPILLEEGLEAVDRIRGPAGTTVTLGIQSPGAPLRSVEVERGRLTSTGRLEARTVEGTNYGYLLFPPISYERLSQDVVSTLQGFSNDPDLEGLILDLRIAGSSRGWPLEALSSVFYDGELGEFYSRENRQAIRVTGQDVNSSQDVPLVLLVGENTTGLPEVFAASLQTRQRAFVVGDTTPGAVETTNPYYLPDGSQAFIASASFMLPGGEELGTSGVTPNLIVEAGWDEVLPDRDPVLVRAVEYLDEQP